MKKSNKRKSVTGKQIANITGLEDDGFITAILKIGATPAEVMLAVEALQDGDCACLSDLSPRAREVYEILEARRDLEQLCENI